MTINSVSCIWLPAAWEFFLFFLEIALAGSGALERWIADTHAAAGKRFE